MSLDQPALPSRPWFSRSRAWGPGLGVAGLGLAVFFALPRNTYSVLFGCLILGLGLGLLAAVFKARRTYALAIQAYPPPLRPPTLLLHLGAWFLAVGIVWGSCRPQARRESKVRIVEAPGRSLGTAVSVAPQLLVHKTVFGVESSFAKGASAMALLVWGSLLGFVFFAHGAGRASGFRAGMRAAGRDPGGEDEPGPRRNAPPGGDFGSPANGV